MADEGPDHDTALAVNAALGVAIIEIGYCKHGKPKNKTERAENAMLDRAIAKVAALKGDA